MKLGEAIDRTAESLCAHSSRYRHWCIAYSGGKDSSTTLSLLIHLIDEGRVPAPASLTVLYADTRLELTPLQVAALKMLEAVKERGFRVEVVLPDLDDRFFVYMFGRGVPPPSNTFRWCTPQLKVEPMETAQELLAVSLGLGEMLWDEKRSREVYRGFGVEKLLVITGVRLGESAVRDERIAMSCSRDGAECGQGWLQLSSKHALNETLAPIVHWRLCHVWAWLTSHAPALGFPTREIALTYGGDEAEEINARTGCVACNLASRDLALDTVLRQPEWLYLRPLKRLRLLYAELKLPHNRLRKPGGDRRQDGELASNQQRMGPLTMDARRLGLETVLGIQEEINLDAVHGGWPAISLINNDEQIRIRQLIDSGTWPEGWRGDEPRADSAIDKVFNDGTVQPLLGISDKSSIFR
jgi:DNA sulfur modification protein DndC